MPGTPTLSVPAHSPKTAPASPSRSQIVMLAHHAKQKMCANVINAHLIEELLAKPDCDLTAIRGLVAKLVAASTEAASTLSAIQATSPRALRSARP